MLILKPNCERCDKTLAPHQPDAMICSFECTFCIPCAQGPLSKTCPNCSGELVPRPTRSEHHLTKHPGSAIRVNKDHP